MLLHRKLFNVDTRVGRSGITELPMDYRAVCCRRGNNEINHVVHLVITPTVIYNYNKTNHREELYRYYRW